MQLTIRAGGIVRTALAMVVGVMVAVAAEVTAETPPLGAAPTVTIPAPAGDGASMRSGDPERVASEARGGGALAPIETVVAIQDSERALAQNRVRLLHQVEIAIDAQREVIIRRKEDLKRALQALDELERAHARLGRAYSARKAPTSDAGHPTCGVKRPAAMPTVTASPRPTTPSDSDPGDGILTSDGPTDSNSQ